MKRYLYPNCGFFSISVYVYNEHFFGFFLQKKKKKSVCVFVFFFRQFTYVWIGYIVSTLFRLLSLSLHYCSLLYSYKVFPLFFSFFSKKISCITSIHRNNSFAGCGANCEKFCFSNSLFRSSISFYNSSFWIIRCVFYFGFLKWKKFYCLCMWGVCVYVKRARTDSRMRFFFHNFHIQQFFSDRFGLAVCVCSHYGGKVKRKNCVKTKKKNFVRLYIKELYMQTLKRDTYLRFVEAMTKLYLCSTMIFYFFFSI